MIDEHSGLLTDLYELTMAAGYLQTRFDARATFELLARDLPPRRNYLVAAGLEQCLDFLENVRFSASDIAFLRHHPAFQQIREEFFDYLAGFTFSGDVWAVPEGTVVFAGEPLLRVTAPIAEAQLMETVLLSTISFQTMVASKAARLVTAARGRQVVEMGARRAHGPQSSIYASRAAAIGGCHGTSNVIAGELFGIPTSGTQAHSWIMAHEDEAEAFRSFVEVFPGHAILLLDTYDVRAALQKILKMGIKPAGVRLDSGDLEKDSRWVRRELDRVGWTDVKIFVSGDLDKARISALVERRARADAFGVGSALATPPDAPYLNLVYKLVEVERDGQLHEAAKFSQSKVTYPGRKQVYRLKRPNGEWRGDVIALESEPSPGGEPLLVPVMRDGSRLHPTAPIVEAREHCLASLALLPEKYRQLIRRSQYPVRHTKRLESMLEEIRERVLVAQTPESPVAPQKKKRPLATQTKNHRKSPRKSRRKRR